MRAALMNLLLLSAFQLASAIVLMELRADHHMQQRLMQLFEADSDYLRVVNVEEEFWHSAKLAAFDNGAAPLSQWLSLSAVSVSITSTNKTCENPNPTDSAVLEMLDFDYARNRTLVIAPSGCSPQDIVLRRGKASRTIFMGEERSWV